jgi:hypothetical protein
MTDAGVSWVVFVPIVLTWVLPMRSAGALAPRTIGRRPFFARQVLFKILLLSTEEPNWVRLVSIRMMQGWQGHCDGAPSRSTTTPERNAAVTAWSAVQPHVATSLMATLLTCCGVNAKGTMIAPRHASDEGLAHFRTHSTVGQNTMQRRSVPCRIVSSGREGGGNCCFWQSRSSIVYMCDFAKVCNQTTCELRSPRHI